MANTPFLSNLNPEERAERIRRVREYDEMMAELEREKHTTPKKEPRKLTPEAREKNRALHKKLHQEMYTAHKAWFEKMLAENEEQPDDNVSELEKYRERRRRLRPPSSRPQFDVPAAAADILTPSSKQESEFTSLGKFEIEIDYEPYLFEFISDTEGTCFLTPAPPSENKCIVLDDFCYDIDPPDRSGICRVIGLKAGDCSMFMTLYNQDPPDHTIALLG